MQSTPHSYLKSNGSIVGYCDDRKNKLKQARLILLSLVVIHQPCRFDDFLVITQGNTFAGWFIDLPCTSVSDDFLSNLLNGIRQFQSFCFFVGLSWFLYTVYFCTPVKLSIQLINSNPFTDQLNGTNTVIAEQCYFYLILFIFCSILKYIIYI